MSPGLHLAETKHKVEPRSHEFSVIHILDISRINTFGYLEHDVARGILKFQCKPWEFRATSCSRHSNVFMVTSMHNLALHYYTNILTNTKSYMSAYVLLDPLNELGECKMRGCAEHPLDFLTFYPKTPRFREWSIWHCYIDIIAQIVQRTQVNYGG